MFHYTPKTLALQKGLCLSVRSNPHRTCPSRSGEDREQMNLACDFVSNVDRLGFESGISLLARAKRQLKMRCSRAALSRPSDRRLDAEEVDHLRCCMNLVLVSSVATCFGARFAEATGVVDLGSTLVPKFQVSFK